jgi:Protein of unknown function (DUF3096)
VTSPAADRQSATTESACSIIDSRVSPTMINMIVLQPLVALIAGIPIFVILRLLNFVVAIYLIIIGIAGLWPHLLL